MSDQRFEVLRFETCDYCNGSGEFKRRRDDPSRAIFGRQPCGYCRDGMRVVERIDVFPVEFGGKRVWVERKEEDEEREEVEQAEEG